MSPSDSDVKLAPSPAIQPETQNGGDGGCWAKIRRFAWIYLATPVLVLATAVLAQSEASLNKLINEWFRSCIIVLDQQPPRLLMDGQAIPFRVHSSGEVPDSFTFFISADKAIIASLRVATPLPGKPPNNLAMHPMAGRECRGKAGEDHCELGASEGRLNDKNVFRDMAIKISDYAPQYALIIEAELPAQPRAASQPPDDLIAYIKYTHNDAAAPTTVCRVETPNLFNILVWANGWLSTIMLCLAVGLLGLLVAKLRRLLTP